MLRFTVTACVASSALLFAASATAQSVWAINGPAGILTHLAGPPVGPCGDPTGPMIGGIPFPAPFACPTIVPFAPPAIGGPPSPGDVTVDKINDLVFGTNGMFITGFSKAGLPVVNFPSPLPGLLTGLGWAATTPMGIGPVLWITNGVVAAAILEPLAGCVGPPPFVFPPFPVAMPGLCTDIDFDPTTGTLFESNTGGLITNQLIGGAAGPFGAFPSGAPCLIMGLNGIAVDTAACMTLYVTDGMSVARVLFGGGLAPATFYSPIPCWPIAGPVPTSGLAFDATPVSYAMPFAAAGFPVPIMGTMGEAITPNPAFALTLTGGIPGSLAFLMIGAAPACPRLPIGFGVSLATFPLAAVVGPIPVPATGSIVLPAAIPPGLACSGATGYVQWIEAKTTGTLLANSNALHVRPASP